MGYEQVYETGTIQSAVLGIDNVYFDNADASYFNITVISPPPPTSTAVATLSGVNVTLADNTTLALQTIPTLNGSLITVPPNGTQSLRCLWNWSAHRSEQIVVQAFTKQGFTVVSNTTTTPAAVIWSVGNVQFDLADLEHFSVNVTNAPVSLGEINITEVDFNQNTNHCNPCNCRACQFERRGLWFQLDELCWSKRHSHSSRRLRSERNDNLADYSATLPQSCERLVLQFSRRKPVR